MKTLWLWRCPECGEVMRAKFERTHTVLCAFVADNLKRDVEKILADLPAPKGEQT